MPSPLTSLRADALARVRVLATDIDDTMTTHAKLTGPVAAAVAELDSAGIEVVLVTGRPAGFVAGLVTYLPGVSRGIAENGGAVVSAHGAVAQMDPSQVEALRERLLACEREILATVAEARPTGDRYARLTDVTFQVAGLSPAARSELDRIAARWGFATVASSVHVHVHTPGVTKATALVHLLASVSPPVEPDEVLTAGDSLTDAPIFDPRHFPLSVGVANISGYLDKIAHAPAYLTSAPEGGGFLEIARALLRAKGRA